MPEESLIYESVKLRTRRIFLRLKIIYLCEENTIKMLHENSILYDMMPARLQRHLGPIRIACLVSNFLFASLLNSGPLLFLAKITSLNGRKNLSEQV